MLFRSKKCKEYKINTCDIDITHIIEKLTNKALTQIVLGLELGNYNYKFKLDAEKGKDEFHPTFNLVGIDDSNENNIVVHASNESSIVVDDSKENNILVNNSKENNTLVDEAIELATSIKFARTMVNTPGNHLRPSDFVERIKEFTEDLNISTQILDATHLKELGMNALLGVGSSSEFPPFLVVLRYDGNKEDDQTYGLIGKGITCDTGGYCLKGAQSMAGIKGDMAGAAAVVGALEGLTD